MRIVVRMHGMCLDSSTEQIRRSLEALSGVFGVEFDFGSRTASVEHDAGVCKLTDLVAAIRRVGQQVDEIIHEEDRVPAPRPWLDAKGGKIQEPAAIDQVLEPVGAW